MKKKIEKSLRIKEGSFTCNYDSIYDIVSLLKEKYSFNDEDLKLAKIDAENNYDGCYYESDTPEIVVSVKWSNIH